MDKLKPNLVVACYGMNDGIYYPFSRKRFDAYKKGMNQLIDRVKDAGAKLILLTPPPFDPEPMRVQGKLRPPGAEKYAWFAVYENYDEVMERYAAWIREQKGRVTSVIDVYTPMRKHLRERRKKDPKYALSTDGVHFNENGHRIIAKTVLDAWRLPGDTFPRDELIRLVGLRQTLLRDAWLSDVGHKRPRTKAGLPLAEAQARAAEIDHQIAASLKKP